MSYYVNLGGIYISGVTDVKLTSGRDITGYDGLGNGNFGIPDDENLREWTISCELSEKNQHNFPHWQAAAYIFKSFETMLKTKDYSRFISVSDTENISELVHLKQYTKKNKYLDAYDVEITIQEYKPVAVKTTGVPYITRPGKIPVPKTVTITKRNTAYSAAKKITGSTPKAGQKGFIGPMQTVVFKNIKNSKPVDNPCTMPTTVSIGVITAPLSSMPVDQSKIVDTSYTGKNFYDGLAESAASTFKSIGKGIEGWLKGGG